MDVLRTLATGSLLLVLACSSRNSEAPPPASSAVVPQAAPNARGTMAAGNAPMPGLVGPRHSEDEEDPSPPGTVEPPEPGTEETEPVDSGVTL